MSVCYLYVWKINLEEQINGLVKIGITNDFYKRAQQYTTYSSERGNYIDIYEIGGENTAREIEKSIAIDLEKYHIYKGGGTEFYKCDITEKLEPYLKSLKINFKRFNKDELTLIEKETERYIIEKEEKRNEEIKRFRKERKNKPYIPRNDQITIIENAVMYFKQYDKGILVLICGIGKTLISLWITQKLKLNTILIGVPNKLLLKQWENVISILFQNVPYLIVSSGVDIRDIETFLQKNRKKCILITTYSSSHKVNTIVQNINFIFEMKILDEVHHLTSANNQKEKTYIQILNIPYIKQISLTATLKQLESDLENVISNDNPKYFGEIIDRRGLLWGITQNIICDYLIQTIITDEEKIDERFLINEKNDKRLFLSAFTSLKSISTGHSHHLLIYSNSKDASSKINQYIKMLLNNNYFSIPSLYYSDYHSEMKLENQKEIINNFEKAKLGIISCVYCLGEGWDFPLLDGIVFAENMSSNIRIVQSALRASRKNKDQADKISKIILPILNSDEWLENNGNPDLQKVREVIYQMGLEDSTITQKIKVFRIKIQKQREKKEKEMIIDLGEYDDKLTQKLRLKTIPRIAIDTTYEKARKIIADKNIKSKESYYELCKRDNRLPKEPEIVFKRQFTNWIEYLSIEQVYYDLETCKNKISEYNKTDYECKEKNLELEELCKSLSKKDSNFPSFDLWVDYYKVKSLADIIVLPKSKRKEELLF